MAESYRYKVLVKTKIIANGTSVVYSNTTPNQETVVTDIFCLPYSWAPYASVFLVVNDRRIRKLLPNPSGQFWGYGLWLVLLQGDELKLEVSGLPGSQAINVRMFGFERFNAPVPGIDTFNYKMVTGDYYWTSGSFPYYPVLTIYTAPADTVFLIHSFWVVADNYTQRFNFELLHDDVEIQYAPVPAGGIWEGHDRRKIILEPGQTLKIRITFVTGTPVQGWLWYFGGVERKNQL